MATLGRPPVKKQWIVERLRCSILSGELPPGARLPTRRELSEQFGGTLTTVQQAVNSLERDGVVVSQGSRGTFVADRPPHLTQFALVFPYEPGDPEWVLYWDHLANVGRRVVREQGVRLSVYTGIDPRHPGTDYVRLLEDVRQERLAGIIFANTPFPLQGTEILEKPGIPRVFMGSPLDDFYPMGCVNIDWESFAAKAVQYLQSQQIKSTAILGQPGNATGLLLQQLDAAGIACPYHHQQAATLENAAWARNLTRLLFDPSHATRPEGLIILDDNLFDHALSGVLDAGLRMPEDLLIVTHSNFPWQSTAPVPVACLGYDMRELLNLLLAELENQRSGNEPGVHLLPAVFEDELPPGTHPIAP